MRRSSSRLLGITSTPVVLLLGGALLLGAAVASERPPRLLIRCDDIGMSHGVNAAVGELLATGLPFSASLMVPTPWFLEAADMLRHRPGVSIGIHLTLNSEWEHYKWGPVSGAAAVPSLVDEHGYLHATERDFAAAAIDLGEVEHELRAQIDRALGVGLDVDYLDYHMLTAVSTPALRAVVERLASDYGLGLSTYFDERSASLWDVEPDRKLAVLLDVVDRLEPGRPNLLVAHLATGTPEVAALIDLNNSDDPYRVARHRSAELAALTSPAFRAALERRGIELDTYGGLVSRLGLGAMRRPAVTGYSMDDPEEDSR